jgi:hypothetical protein
VVNATPRPLYLRATDPIPIVKEAVWASGTVWTDAENPPPTGIRFPYRPAHCESLYRLSYPVTYLEFLGATASDFHYQGLIRHNCLHCLDLGLE